MACEPVSCRTLRDEPRPLLRHPAALSGVTVITDSGYFSAGVTESFPEATPVVNFLLGRY